VDKSEPTNSLFNRVKLCPYKFINKKIIECSLNHK
jgi:hypothetical protein